MHGAGEPEEFITMLELPAVKSTKGAVQVGIAHPEAGEEGGMSYCAEFLDDEGLYVRVEAETREALIIALKDVSLRPMTIKHGSVVVAEEEKFSIWAAARELRLGCQPSN